MNNVPTLNIDAHRPVRLKRIATTGHNAPDAQQISSAERLLNLHERLLGSSEQKTLTERFRLWAREHDLAEEIVYSPGSIGHREQGEPCSRDGQKLDFALKPGDSHLGMLAVICRERPDHDEFLFMSRAVKCLGHYLEMALSVQSYRELAMHDGLTGLLNRKSLDARLAEEISRAGRHGAALSMMLIDVDHFKKLNDESGHLSGDQTLRLLADIFTDVTRESDLAFRFGGDEFAILLPFTDLLSARCTAERIRTRLSSMPAGAFCVTGSLPVLRPDISIGIAQYRQGDAETDLLRRADTHLYQAKARGRGRICTQL